MFDGPLAGVKISGLIVPIRIPIMSARRVGGERSIARFTCRRSNTYNRSITRTAAPKNAQAQRLFFRRHGMDESLTDKLLGRGQEYLKRVSTLPASYRRISHGDEISIGTRRFKVITGGGHALDQVMLYCAADKLFLSADQVLSRFRPMSASGRSSPKNSLGEYLASLASLTTTLPYDPSCCPAMACRSTVKTRIKQLAITTRSVAADCGACRETSKTSKTGTVVFHKHVLDRSPDGICRRRTDRACQLHAGRGRPKAQEVDGALLPGDMIPMRGVWRAAFIGADRARHGR